LQIGVGHLGLRLLLILLNSLYGLEVLLGSKPSSPGATMEANIPSKLDIAAGLLSGSARDEASKLDDALIGLIYRFSSGKSELVATVLKILAIGIIERGNLSLGGTVLLQRKGHIVVLRREQRRVGNPGGKASG